MKSKQSLERRRKSNIVIRKGKLTFRKNWATDLDPRSHTTTADWKRISDVAASIPKRGKYRILTLVAAYRARAASERRSLDAKRRVLRMRNAIRKILMDGERLNKDPIFFSAGLYPTGSRTGPIAEDLTKRFESLIELDQILSDAQDRMVTRRGRKSFQNLEDFIYGLVVVYADANGGAHLKRSTKAGFTRPTNKLVVECAKIADPNLTEASIENTLTHIISMHHDTLSRFGYNSASGDWVGI